MSRSARTSSPPVSGPAPAPIAVDDLSKVYPGGIQALRGISFQVRDGEIFGLLGPNGAGKTTTMGILTTLVRPSGGHATVDGHDVTTEPLAVRQAMGVVFQDSVLDNDFTGRENLRLHARLWRVPAAAERISALLDAVDLTDRADHGVRSYSGGMKRRLEIARALLGRPRVLFLDEPTLGLDPLVRNELWRMIQELKAQQKVTVLVSTHYLEEAQGVCDRVAIIDHGQIVCLDSPSRLVADLGQHILELAVNGDPSRVRQALRRSAGVGDPVQLGTTVAAPSDLPPAELNELAGQLRLAELGAATTTVRPATLNDVFLHLTHRTEKARQGAPA